MFAGRSPSETHVGRSCSATLTSRQRRSEIGARWARESRTGGLGFRELKPELPGLVRLVR